MSVWIRVQSAAGPLAGLASGGDGDEKRVFWSAQAAFSERGHIFTEQPNDCV